MKTISTIMAFVIALTAFTVSVQAQPVPCPINIDVDSPIKEAGLTLALRDNNGNTIETQTTYEDGSVIFDLYGKAVCSGTYPVTVLECESDAKCTKSFGPSPGVYQTWNLGEANTGGSPIVCGAGTHEENGICVSDPTTPTEDLKCVIDYTMGYGENLDVSDSQCEVHVKSPEYPTVPQKYDDASVAAAAIAALLLGGIGGYMAVRIRKKNDGSTVKEHKHYGIQEYHSIETSHKDAKIRHPKGCINPVYQNGKYVKCGDKVG